MVRFVLSFCLIGLMVAGQKANHIHLDVRDRSFVFERLVTRYRFENDGTGLEDVVARVRIQNDLGASQWRERRFEYHPSKERLEILYFRVVKPSGVVTNVPSGTTQDSPPPLVTKTIRPLDYYEKRVFLPPLSPGDVIEYSVRTVIDVPLASGQFWTDYTFNAISSLDEQMEVDIPKNRKVKVKAVPGLKAWITEENGRRVYHWSVLRVAALGVRRVSNGRFERNPDVQLTSFASWSEVGRWYSDLEKPHRGPSLEVRVKAGELSRGLNSDLEKAEALYDFTAKKIKYLSLASLGIAGYEPHSAVETLRLGYGDCKDKSVLLAALLEAEGMHASSVLISARRTPDPDIPSPWPFTHVITMLTLQSAEIWMDTSSPPVPFRTLPAPLREKQSLVIPPVGVPSLRQTPSSSF